MSVIRQGDERRAEETRDRPTRATTEEITQEMTGGRTVFGIARGHCEAVERTGCGGRTVDHPMDIPITRRRLHARARDNPRCDNPRQEDDDQQAESVARYSSFAARCYGLFGLFSNQNPGHLQFSFDHDSILQDSLRALSLGNQTICLTLK
jgi:hypothetical protein